MVKVYTKYDTIPACINVPHVRELEYCPISDNTPMDTSAIFLHSSYFPTKVTEGLEGVRFVEFAGLE